MNTKISSDTEYNYEELLKYNSISSDEISTLIPGVTYSTTIFTSFLCSTSTEKLFAFSISIKTNTLITASLEIIIPQAKFYIHFPNVIFDSNKTDELFIIASRTVLLNPRNNFLKNGKLQLIMRGHIKSNFNNGIAESTSLGKLLWEDKDKDVTLSVENQTIMAHAIVLQKRSEFFKTFFITKSTENFQYNITIKHFSYLTTKMAIEHCYDIHQKYRENYDYWELLKFANFYQMKDLKNHTELILSYTINPDNVSFFINECLVFNAMQLIVCCENFISFCIQKNICVRDLDILDTVFKAELFDKLLSIKS